MSQEASSLREERHRLTQRIDRQRQARAELLQSLRSQSPQLAAAQDFAVSFIRAYGSHYSSFTNRKLREQKLGASPDSPHSEKQSKLREDGSLEKTVKRLVANSLVSLPNCTPVDSAALSSRVVAELSGSERDAITQNGGGVVAVEAALRALASSSYVEIEERVVSDEKRVVVLLVDKARLHQLYMGTSSAICSRSHQPGGDRPETSRGNYHGGEPQKKQANRSRGVDGDPIKDIESLLSKRSYRQAQKFKAGEELLTLLHRPTAKETAAAAKFKTKGGSALNEYCPNLTKEDCRCHRGSFWACEKLHFRRIVALHTDVSLGDCSFLDTCRHMKTCKYVHYELDKTSDLPGAPRPLSLSKRRTDYCSDVELGEPQWINCDIRTFKMEVLGQFGVIMADPPWDIHMELPYGTMSDDEMRSLNVPVLQTDGLIFLWVTGRAMELGRECLDLWGYKRVEELIWVKTNQLQRIIRTGRTGHWLNHSKEHCLVGIKGNPGVNRNIDTDVIVAEVRETSRKPDEMYPLLERLSPGTRKLELFARMHNTHAGWISLGNQLNGVQLVEESLRSRYKAAYPEVEPGTPDKSQRRESGENIVEL